MRGDSMNKLHGPMRNTNKFVKVVVGGWLIAAAFGGACKSPVFSRYVSPRIEGRVVDSNSHQPVEDVVVRRVISDEMYRVEGPAKGGAQMEKAPGVRTGSDGTFVMDSQRDLALIGKAEWYSVSLSFQHPGYEGYTVTYTWLDATNTAKGEPLVKAGNIVLNAAAVGQ